MYKKDTLAFIACINTSSNHINISILLNFAGFLPTFGPSLLHMYGTSTSGALAASGEEGPYHRGAMLVSLRTIVPYYQQGLKSTSVEPVAPLQPVNIDSCNTSLCITARHRNLSHLLMEHWSPSMALRFIFTTLQSLKSRFPHDFFLHVLLEGACFWLLTQFTFFFIIFPDEV